MGPLGLLSPHPGVSYLFSGMDASLDGGDASLWGIVGGSNYNGMMVGIPWTASMGEMFIKIDGKFKVTGIAILASPVYLYFLGLTENHINSSERVGPVRAQWYKG